MSRLAYWWRILTGAAQQAGRIELLETIRDEDKACGRTEAAEHLNSLIRKHDRRKSRKAADAQRA